MMKKQVLLHLACVVFLVLPGIATAQTVVDTVPFFTDFEDTTDNARWTFVNGTCYNYLCIDTGVNMTTNGARALYVTQQDQTTQFYSYKTGSSTSGDQSYVQSRVFVYRNLYFPDTGRYDVGYWWNCYGESIYDYGRVALAPANWSFSASTVGWDSTTSVSGQYFGSHTLPSSFICLDRGYNLSGAAAATYYSTTIHITTAGTYRLVILWQNDGNTGTNPPLMIDDLNIKPHNCPSASNLMASNLTTTSVTLTWDFETTPTSWTVMWDTLGATAFTNTTTVTTNSATITGLTPGGSYDMKVVANCTGAETSLDAFYRVTMPTCPLLETLPYTYNFDSATSYGDAATPPVLPCWIHQNEAPSVSYRGYPYLYSTTYTHSGSHALRFYYTTTQNYDAGAGIALPGINRDSIDIQHVVVNFYMASSSTTYHPRIVVGVMSDPYNRASFVGVDTVTTSSTTPLEFNVPLSGYTGNGNFIALFQTAPASGTTSYCYIDDITLLNEACPRPSVTIDSTGTNDAYLSWLSTGAANYSIATSTSEQTSPTITVTDTTYHMYNLQPNTQYTIWIRSNCSDAIGNWQAVTFRTECGPLDSLPWTETFENTSSTGTGSVAECWLFLSDGTGTYHNYYPYINTASIYAHSGSRSAYVYLYPTTSTTVGVPTYETLVLPAVDTTELPLNTLRLSFYAATSSTSYHNDAFIGVMTDPYNDSTFYRLDSVRINHETHQLYEFDLDSCPAGYSYVAIRFSRNTTYQSVYIDDVTLSVLPDCRRVTDVNVVNLTGNSADVYWTESQEASEWQVVYGPHGFDPADSTAVTVYDTVVNLTGLTPTTSYDVYITPACDNGGIAETVLFTFTTPCVLIDSLPYVMDFEGLTTNTMTTAANIPCWTLFSDGAQYHYPYVSSSSGYCYNGTRGTYWYYTSSSSIYYSNRYALISPGINTETYDMDHIEVSFMARATSTSYTPTWTVGVMTNPNDMNTFVPCQTVTIDDNTTTWHALTASLASYSGAGNFIAIISTYNPMGAYTYWYGAMDSISINYVNCPMPQPTVVATVDSAYINWTGTASSYEYELIPNDSTATGSGTVVSSDELEIGGLTNNTLYALYMRSLCDDDTSDWSVTTFRTDCGIISNIPYFYSFEDSPVGSANFAYCWTRTAAPASNNSYPYVSQSTTYAHTGVRGLYWYAGSTSSYSDYNIAVLPEVDVSEHALNTLLMSFWARSSSLSYSPWFIGGVMTDPTNDSTFEALDTFYVNDNTWQRFEMAFDQYSGSGAYPAVKSVKGTEVWTAYLDDFGLDVMPSCAAPVRLRVNNVTTNSATISWSNLTSAGSFVVEYTDGTTTMLDTVTVTTDALTGLTANTPYTVRVRSLCSSDTSGWSSTVTFRTECVAISTLPYVESFENETPGSYTSTRFASCWNRLPDAYISYYYPYVASSSTYAHTGTKGLYWYSPSTISSTYGSAYYIVLPELDDNLAIDTLMLTFWLKASSGSYAPLLKVGVMDADIADSSFVCVDTIDHTAGNVWTQYTVYFNNYTGTGRRIAIKSDAVTAGSTSTYQYWYAYLDDFTLDYGPSCFPARNLTVDTTTASSASLHWSGSSPSYILSYQGPNDSVPNTRVLTDTAVTLTGLPFASTYHWWVQGLCGVGDTSVSSDVSTFATALCDNAILDTLFGFDSTTNTSTSTYIPVHEHYNYSFSEQIIDSAELAEAGVTTISAIELYTTLATTHDNNCYIYLGHTSRSTFSSGVGGWVPVDSLTLVWTGDMNLQPGWNSFGASDFVWDGVHNLVIAVKRDNGSYVTAVNKTTIASTTGNKSKYVYNDASPYVMSSLNTYSGTALDKRNVWRFASCEAQCFAPVVTATVLGYDQASLTWTSDNAPMAYELAVKTAGEATWPESTTVADSINTYLLTGLLPATTYQFRLRQLCDSTVVSDWAEGSFITDSLPCFAPTNLMADDVQGQTATLSWSTAASASDWTLHVFNTTFDQTFTATDSTYTVTGLTAGVTYQAAVRANCGGGLVESDYSDTISFTTVECDVVSNLAVSDITGTTATVTWTPGDNNTGSWEIEYGYHGYGQGEALGTYQVTAPTYTLMGLTAETHYDVTVRAVCAAGYISNNVLTDFTTLAVGIDDVNTRAAVMLSPNPAVGSTTVTLSGVSGTVTLSVIDMSGRTVRSFTMECSGNCSHQVDVDDLAAGAYFVRLSGNGVNTVKKLVVK